MKHRFTALLALVMSLSTTWYTHGGMDADNRDGAPPDKQQAAAAKPGGDFKDGQQILLVRFRQAGDVLAQDAIHATVGAERVRSFKLIPVDVVRLAPSMDAEAAMAAYRSRPEVAYVVPRQQVHILAVPNDPRFAELWGLRNTGQTGGTAGADIHAVDAWNTTTGSRNVIVAVIDTGIDYNHPDLAANVWTNPGEIAGNGIDDDSNGIIDDIHGARWTSNNGTPTSGDPMDDHSHGTHCAGTIGGVGNNSVGVAGVNWQVSIMGLKFLNGSGSGSNVDAIAAIEYAVDQGAHFTSNSWGGGGHDAALRDAIAAAGAAGQLFVAAAGNDSLNTDVSPHYPSSYDLDSIVSVASSDHNDARSSFSNVGIVTTDLAAPGSSILSTTPGDTYGLKSGTSMATPHVAGVTALLLAQHPGATPAQLKSWLMNGTTPLPAWESLVASGGRLNAAEALRVAALPVGTNPVTGLTATSEPEATTVQLNWSNPAAAALQQVIIRRGTTGYPETWTAGSAVYSGTGTSVVDGPLGVGTTVYYSAWAVHTGPAYSPIAVARCTVGAGSPTDWFTEQFDAGDSDLANHTITFAPVGGDNHYAASVATAADYPVDPTGGTSLPLSDDDYESVALGASATFPFFGQNYSTFYVGSNGYITFGEGDSDFSESISDHFELPRISALFDDFDPEVGQVTWKQLGDRAVVTWHQVPQYDETDSNSFQVELFFDGTIRITWLALAATDGVAGLSAGTGLPPRLCRKRSDRLSALDRWQPDDHRHRSPERRPCHSLRHHRPRSEAASKASPSPTTATKR